MSLHSWEITGLLHASHRVHFLLPIPCVETQYKNWDQHRAGTFLRQSSDELKTWFKAVSQPEELNIRYFPSFTVLWALPWQRGREWHKEFNNWIRGSNEQFQARHGRGFLGNSVEQADVCQSVVLLWHFMPWHRAEQSKVPSAELRASALLTRRV